MTTGHSVLDTPPSAVRPLGAQHGGYVVFALMLIYALSFLDRQVVAILAEPIKTDLHLADWQIGLMSGLAFALLYTVLGIPIARLAERWHRPFIIAAAVTLWSGFTVLCGLTQNFIQLLAARAGVGIGEAGCTPPALSLIADCVPREKRASAMGFYMAGAPLGALAGMVIGGLLADQWGWRMTFIVIGAPGVLMGLLVALTMKEPRLKIAWKRTPAATDVSLRVDALQLASKRAYRLIVVAITARAFETYGLSTFYGSFFLRNHLADLQQMSGALGLKPLGFLGLALGLTLGIAGIVGSLVGGYLSDRVVARDARVYVTLPAACSFIAVPFAVSAFLVDSLALALVCLGLAHIFSHACTGPLYAAVQSVVRPSSRATATAVLLFIVSLIGLGLGPLAAGALSDFLGSVVGLGSAGGIRGALVVFAFVGVISGAAAWAARTSLAEDTVS